MARASPLVERLLSAATQKRYFMSKSIKLCKTTLQPQEQNGVSWLDLGPWQIHVEGNSWVSSSQRGGSAILGGPWWVWGLPEGSQGTESSLAVQSCFPNLAAVTGLRLGSSPCFGTKIANITEIQNLTKKSYIFLPTLTNYSIDRKSVV